MPNIITDNPAIVSGLIRAILAAGVLFGLNISEEQKAALVIVISLVLTLVTVKFTVPKTPSADAPPAAIQDPQPPV